MAKTYIVAPGQEFEYPADAQSLQLIKQFGGRSKLNETALLQVRFKTVTEGQDCSDMPADALALYLERGLIIEQGPMVEQGSVVEQGETSNG